MRGLAASILVLLALGTLLWPDKPTELAVNHGVSSVPSRERLSAEGTSPPPTTVTTRQRASRSRTASRQPAAPRARTAPTPGVVSGDLFDRLAMCESGMRQDAVGGGGRYFSYFQWSLSTWRAAGGTGDPRNVDYGTQKVIAMRWAQRSNPYGQWPVCWPRAVRG